MPTTSKGLRYPASNAAPNGPQQIQDLATDVDGQLFINGGTSGVLAGSAPPSGTPFIVKTFYASVVFNGSGDATVITFPGGAFPNGLLAVLPIHYSAGSAPSNDLEFVPWGATLSAVNFRCYGPTGAVFGGTGIAMILIAIGW